MIATFDQLSGGRICINLIAGQSEAENASEGIKWGKEERYEIMDEEVSILKALWTARGPVTFDGKFYQLKGAQIRPHPLQKPYPQLLSRRRLAAGLGDLGQAFRRASVLGRHLRAHPRQHGR